MEKSNNQNSNHSSRSNANNLHSTAEMGTSMLEPPSLQLKSEEPSLFDRSSDNPPIQRSTNPRFKDNDEFDNAESGSNYLQIGDSGSTVRILQQALIDAGYELPVHGVDGIFRRETQSAVKQFQTAQGIAADGVVGPDTMAALNIVHDQHHTVADIARSHDAANPLEGTRTLTPEEAADFNSAIDTTVRTPGGALPTFDRNNGSGNYDARIRAALTTFIDNSHASFRQEEAARADPNNLEDWSRLEDVASISKTETDALYGTYNTGPAFEHGVNLFDAWEVESDHISRDPSYADFIAEDVLDAFLGYAPIASENGTPGINEEHGAVPSRGTEAAIIQTIKNGFLNDPARKRQLLDIQIAWPGLADDGEIFLQRFKGSDKAENRDKMWEFFATCVHEYIHTLEHPDHEDYRRTTFEEHEGGRTLREGVTDYFTKIVWDNVNFADNNFRRSVEGPYNEVGVTHPIQTPGFYGETSHAEKAAGIVGVRNLMAAFFLGHTELIGDPSP